MFLRHVYYKSVLTARPFHKILPFAFPMTTLATVVTSFKASPMTTFPVPVGGVPQPDDFAPSILFAILYGCLIPLAAYRLIRPESRNIVLLGTSFFSIERYVPLARSCEVHERRSSCLLTVLYYSLFALRNHITSNQQPPESSCYGCKLPLVWGTSPSEMIF